MSETDCIRTARTLHSQAQHTATLRWNPHSCPRTQTTGVQVETQYASIRNMIRNTSEPCPAELSLTAITSPAMEEPTNEVLGGGQAAVGKSWEQKKVRSRTYRCSKESYYSFGDWDSLKDQNLGDKNYQKLNYKGFPPSTLAVFNYVCLDYKN